MSVRFPSVSVGSTSVSVRSLLLFIRPPSLPICSLWLSVHPLSLSVFHHVARFHHYPSALYHCPFLLYPCPSFLYHCPSMFYAYPSIHHQSLSSIMSVSSLSLSAHLPWLSVRPPSYIKLVTESAVELSQGAPPIVDRNRSYASTHSIGSINKSIWWDGTWIM